MLSSTDKIFALSSTDNIFADAEKIVERLSFKWLQIITGRSVIHMLSVRHKINL